MERLVIYVIPVCDPLFTEHFYFPCSHYYCFFFQVLGVARCPLYSLPNGLGFPAFLKNQFIGNSCEQLVYAIQALALMEPDDLQQAIKTSKQIVNCYVTAESVKY